MLKKIICTIVGVVAFYSISLAAKPKGAYYQFSMNLNKVVNDRLEVELIAPAFSEEEVVYRFPKMVPGTYAIYDFGRFISGLKAYNKEGVEISSTRLDTNSWKIRDAKNLYKISYWVDDSFDADTNNFIFEPAGTNIEDGKNFLINTFGFFGYFDGYKSLNFEISITKPADFYGATSLTSKDTSKTKDFFVVPDYMELADAPIMYNRPDTVSVNVGGTQILTSVYSPNKKASSVYIANNVFKILVAAQNYLDGKLPIDKYAFIIYLFPGKSGSGSAGALEHSYSSVYYLQERDSSRLASIIKDIASHEFFHVITPLNIHSEEIGDFDFANPKMSQHLWLYEGITEYTAHYVQLWQKQIKPEDFFDRMQEKMENAQLYYNDSLPFTVMSKGALDIYEPQYGNVYEKGALIGLCLDIKLRSLSDGAYGLKDLIKDLSKKYGKHKSFKDDELFSEITAMTYPEIGDFFQLYVAGDKPLPFAEIFDYIGYSYVREKKEKDFSLGGTAVKFDYINTGRFFISDTTGMNEFGKAMAYKPYDAFYAMNGKKITPRTFYGMIGDWKGKAKEGDKLTITVLRKNKKGKDKKVKLSAKVFKADVKRENVITEIDQPSIQQLKIRKAWLGTKE